MELQTGLYRHYKGQHYRVLGVARHSESEETLVVYQALYGEFGLWVRPLGMFTEAVEVDGELVPRFALVSAENDPLGLTQVGFGES
ncbi:MULTISPECIES: DUF1653 domain-containing protein [Pseudomonas]|jgi:hypothetical protein|uniref:DUF1653 domain-containing protein n=1 Tax=Pseudomonas citronellolis TaxID=53408 RepID=A0A127MQ35_9PSED|nr:MULTISPECIES: DUF1653 domain-containing protein [Pseudomonas]KSW26889.1 TonB box-like protein [Pseudomonas sp. ADP]AMO75369.1 hypothetical protein PcP3B5_19150 [Pseudomonas citronellolis]ANI14193.1 TonB box-like protein [Pseudomonas citronellolis]KES25492.1 hypothetical protein FG99_05105 [Pseudomonas sp. AAC]KRV81926.1 TonB box-like protein [Pseudomonas citronellolis]